MYFIFRAAKLENDMILKTKNMRMKEQNKSQSNYKYCLIRVKYPDCLILQVNLYLNILNVKLIILFLLFH
jgi:hypothetical protein